MTFKITKRKYYLYRCARCGRETEFTIRLPEHLLSDDELAKAPDQSYRRCGGKYEFVKEVEQ